MSVPGRWDRRHDWADLPAPLLAEAEGRLGAVRGFEPRRGGFSYGVLGVLTRRPSCSAASTLVPYVTGARTSSAMIRARSPRSRLSTPSSPALSLR
ncbi:hypothetical protein [Nonomuraea fuscirosea]|uniref:hypothetical protein n=1 Tax=Nonomuraea fuscirosea TaxID=1291556 RepID=UPI003425C51C